MDYAYLVGSLYASADILGYLDYIALRAVELAFLHERLQALEVFHSDEQTVADLFALVNDLPNVLLLISDDIRTFAELVHYICLVYSFLTLSFEILTLPLRIAEKDIARGDRLDFQS